MPGVPRRVPRRRGRGPGGRNGANGAGDEAAIRYGVSVAEEVSPSATREAPGGRAAAGGAGGIGLRRRRQEGDDNATERAGAGAISQAELRGRAAAVSPAALARHRANVSRRGTRGKEVAAGGRGKGRGGVKGLRRGSAGTGRACWPGEA